MSATFKVNQYYPTRSGRLVKCVRSNKIGTTFSAGGSTNIYTDKFGKCIAGKRMGLKSSQSDVELI